MKKDNRLQDKEIESLFKEMILINPSKKFTENLMLRIEREAAKAQRKRKWIAIGQMAVAVSGMILIPCLALYIYSLLTPNFSIAFPDINIHFDPLISLVGLAILLLLMADVLLRKHVHKKT